MASRCRLTSGYNGGGILKTQEIQWRGKLYHRRQWYLQRASWARNRIRKRYRFNILGFNACILIGPTSICNEMLGTSTKVPADSIFIFPHALLWVQRLDDAIGLRAARMSANAKAHPCCSVLHGRKSRRELDDIRHEIHHCWVIIPGDHCKRFHWLNADAISLEAEFIANAMRLWRIVMPWHYAAAVIRFWLVCGIRPPFLFCSSRQTGAPNFGYGYVVVTQHMNHHCRINQICNRMPGGMFHWEIVEDENVTTRYTPGLRCLACVHHLKASHINTDCNPPCMLRSHPRMNVPQTISAQQRYFILWQYAVSLLNHSKLMHGMWEQFGWPKHTFRKIKYEGENYKNIQVKTMNDFRLSQAPSLWNLQNSTTPQDQLQQCRITKPYIQVPQLDVMVQ